LFEIREEFVEFSLERFPPRNFSAGKTVEPGTHHWIDAEATAYNVWNASGYRQEGIEVVVKLPLPWMTHYSTSGNCYRRHCGVSYIWRDEVAPHFAEEKVCAVKFVLYCVPHHIPLRLYRFQRFDELADFAFLCP